MNRKSTRVSSTLFTDMAILSKKVEVPYRYVKINALQNVGAKPIIILFKHGDSNFKGMEEKRVPLMSTNEFIWRIRHPINLIEYHPLKEPFIPDFMYILINVIEHKCREMELWDEIYTIKYIEGSKMVRPYLQEINELIDLLIKEKRYTPDYRVHVFEILNKKPINILILTMQKLITTFKTKLLIITKEPLLELSKYPLHTKIRRANPMIKDVVRDMMYRRSRTEMDTMSFLMLHLTHIAERAKNHSNAQHMLARIYGSLLIKLNDMVIIDNSSYISPEHALFLAILDQCNPKFWNDMMMKMGFSSFALEEDELHHSFRQFKKSAHVFKNMPPVYKVKEMEFENREIFFFKTVSELKSMPSPYFPSEVQG